MYPWLFWTLSIDQAGLELKMIRLPMCPRVLGLKAYATTPGF